MCCVGLIHCRSRCLTLVSSGVTAGAPYLQVSLLYFGGSALYPPRNVSAPPLPRSEENRKKDKRFVRRHIHHLHTLHWNVSPAFIIIPVGFKLQSNLPVRAIVMATYLLDESLKLGQALQFMHAISLQQNALK